MKKFALVCSLLVMTSAILLSQPLSKATKDISYKFVSSSGTNASAVVWHPEKQLYFTVIAGNASFPLEAFDEKGKSVYSEEINIDCRGMWYNPTTKNIEVNGYDNNGWASIIFNEKFNFHEVKTICSGMKQPDANVCGTYYTKKKSVIFLNEKDLCIDVYNYKNPGKVKKIKLQLRSDNLDPYNTTTVAYTGKKGFEFVLLNVDKYQLDYFDSKGQFAGSTTLPKTAIVSYMFKFAFANDRVFLYDKEVRTWTAFKVF
ncbi:MAG TPA: hypothetical protein PKN32_01250 [Bacteroidales bacterium]|nr:hypothetical protein [Bacteroidales bacterium]